MSDKFIQLEQLPRAMDCLPVQYLLLKKGTDLFPFVSVIVECTLPSKVLIRDEDALKRALSNEQMITVFRQYFHCPGNKKPHCYGCDEDEGQIKTTKSRACKKHLFVDVLMFADGRVCVNLTESDGDHGANFKPGVTPRFVHQDQLAVCRAIKSEEKYFTFPNATNAFVEFASCYGVSHAKDGERYKKLQNRFYYAWKKQSEENRTRVLATTLTKKRRHQDEDETVEDSDKFDIDEYFSEDADDGREITVPTNDIEFARLLKMRRRLEDQLETLRAKYGKN